MTAIKDDYDGYISHMKLEGDQSKRNDIKTIIKWVMIKRTLIKLLEFLITGLIATGILTSFLGV